MSPLNKTYKSPGKNLMIILNPKQQTPRKYHKKRKENVYVYSGD